MFGLIGRLLRIDLAIDLGTANTLIYERGAGIVCNEPSLVVMEKGVGAQKSRVLEVGNGARNLLGMDSENLSVVKPIREGVISDCEITELLLKRLVSKVTAGRGLFKPRVLITVPRDISPVEKRAVRESAERLGAREVLLIDEPMAAAIGGGLPVTEPCGSLILNIGGGTAEVAVICYKGILFSKSLRMGGDKMDLAIVSHLRQHHGLLIGERTAEEIKILVGSAMPTGEDLVVEARGRDTITGMPKVVNVSEDDVRWALRDPINKLVGVVKVALEKTPPELTSDIMDRGLALSGGGALLRNLDLYLANELAIPVHVVDDPLASAVRGTGSVLDRFQDLKEVVFH